MREFMRVSTLILALTLASGSGTCGRAKHGAPARVASGVSTDKHAATKEAAPAKVDFAAQVRPILESRCTPCHFAGGMMYQRLPFDRPETIKTLGTKLFGRITDENEQRLIREFLTQQSGNDRTLP